MKYCRKCGQQIDDEAVVCPYCGVSQAIGDDSGSIGWTVLGCCIPVVGLILWIVWKDTKPKSSKAAGIGALIAVVIVALYYVLITVAGIAVSASM